ncbi:hypothetical protein Vi05172_g10334 [Venturia inaequalis]|nr:hypothetical protein Vi05172_g10334 [Venturia inaequalis]
MMMWSVAIVAVYANVVAGGTVLWDGRFDLSTDATYKSSFASKVYSALTTWSFSSEVQVGPYEYYIPAANSATAPISNLIQLSPAFKHPADKSSGQGVKISLAQKAGTNYQWRTELIPHTFDAGYSKKGMINQGLVFYHFSMMRKDVNPPSKTQDHQMCYFENGHFVEMRYGLLAGSQSTEGSLLHAFIDGKSRWNSTWEADVWHNIAYEIDFSKNTVGFWHSTGNDPLVQIQAPIKASTSSNGRDFHLGGLKLPATGTGQEDWYFSGVYIESSPITKELSGPAFV